MNLKNVKEAKKYLEDKLISIHGPFNVKLKEGRRREHFELYVGIKNYYCIFKHQIFFKFGEIFNLSGAGESLNKEVLDYIEQWAFEAILIIYPGGKVYYVDPYTWIDYVKEHNTIRTTSDGEITTSISMKLLKNMFEDSK